MSHDQNAATHAETPPLLSIILAALYAARRIPEHAPDMALPAGFHRGSMIALEIDRVQGGYVADLVFSVAPGEPNILGTPENAPWPTYLDAFLAGAALVCEVVNGSPKLPFDVDNDDIRVIGMSDAGELFVMRRPLPTEPA